MKFRLITTFIFLVFCQTILAQLSKKHYIPPLTSGDNFREQFIYISTPKTNNVSYKIIPIGNPSLPEYSGIVSNNSPVIQPILDANSNPDLDSDTQLHINRTNLNGTKITDKGFIIEASDVVYVSVRVLTSAVLNGSPVHAGALVSKGNAALGKEFRIGAFVNEPTVPNLHTSFAAIMATEDNTKVDFGNSIAGLLLPSGVAIPPTITLNEHESFIIALGGNQDPRNLVGGLIISDKNIVVNAGSATGSFGPNGAGAGGQDYGFDQIVGADRIGNEYILVKGDGINSIENVLIVAHEDNTQITINNSVITTINAGGYYVAEGNLFSGNNNMYINTSKKVFVYQGIGTASLANQGMFFVPPLSCENKGNVDNIPNIDKVGDLTFDGGVTIVTNTGSTILINDQPISNFTTIGPSAVTGNPNYVTYRVTGLSGNVKVTSDNELYCAYFNANGAATTGAFYSGFPTPPEFTFNTTVSVLGNCIPNVTLEGANTNLFDRVRWEYFNPATNTWEQRSSTENYKPIASEPGRYRLVGIIDPKPNCPGNIYESSEIPVSICPDDYDGDLSIDNLDVDLDNDGILNCDESYGNLSLNLSDVNLVNYTIPTTTPQIQNVSSTITKDEAANSITGNTNGNFTSTLVAANTSNLTYELSFPENVNIKLTPTGSNTQEATVYYILKIEPNSKNITLLDPDGQLLVDSDFDGAFETGVTFISGSEIRFQINNTSTGTPFQFVANQIDKLIFEHHSTGLTTTNAFNANIQLTCHNRDSDGDGIPDAFDLDSDNDGVPDLDESTATKITLLNTDANNDGLDDAFNGVTTGIDTDGDGIPNYLDVDSDNDGIFDWVEAGITTEVDANNDGILDNANSSTVGINGLLNSLETTADSNILNYTIADTDGDNSYNFLELDSDNDDCFDVFEAGFTDANFDGILDANPFAVNNWGKVINNADGYTAPNANYTTSSPITVTNFTDVAFCENTTDIITIDTSADVFQWQLSTNGGINWINLSNDATYSGVTTKDLQITTPTLSFNNYQYRVLLSRTGNSCTDKPSNAIVLTVNPLPIIKANPEIDQCIDANDTNPTVNLTVAQSNITDTPNVTFTYFSDTAGTNQITDPTSYPVQVNTTQSVYVRVTSDQNCFGPLVELKINVGQTPDNPYNDIQPPVCDDLLDANGNDTPGMNDDTDFITNFVLDRPAIINSINPPANTEVFFYENRSDRNNNLNAIDITNYRNNINKIDITTIPEGIQFPIYYKIISTVNSDCQGLGEFYLQIHSVPVANTVSDIEECDDALSGSTTDGRNANINLRAKVPAILGNQSSSDYQVTFHTTQNGASTNTDVITNDTNYTSVTQSGFTQGTTSEQIIYVRVTSLNGPQCYNANTSFKIIIQPIPTVSTTITNLIACDVATVSDSDPRNRIAQNIDLTVRDAEILAGRTNYEVEYYITQQDAQNRTNRISNPSNFENTAAETNFPSNFASNDPATQTIFFIVVDNNGLQCPSVFSTFTLFIYPEPATQPINTLSYCDNDDDGDDTNGIIQNIDLNGKIPEILGAGVNVNDYNVSFHPSQNDAENNTSNLTSPYTNRNRNETIYVRVHSKISGCTNTTANFALVINPLPSFTVTTPQILCLNDVPLNIRVENTADTYSYEWRNASGAIIGTSNNVNIASGGNYTVTATTTNGTNCSRTESIVVNESNIASLTESLITIVDESNNIGASGNLSISIDNTNNKLGPGDYQFAIINTDTGERTPFIGFQDSPIFEGIEGGIYQIIVNDKNGCTPDATLTISVLQFPKFFTPNNDGQNDFWIIKGANKTLYPNSSINIFNRYGKLVAQLEIGGQGWDGTYNGTLLPSDDYWYNITLIPADATKNSISKKGNFSLLRR